MAGTREAELAIQRLLEEGVARSKFSRYRKLSVSGSGVMAGSYPEGAPAVLADKRQQFGNRFLSDPARVFHHNAWDNVEWSEEQAAAAERKVQENSTQRVCQEKQVDYEINAHKYWNNFYKIHENGFFKDRHWLFTEFPELAPSQNQNHLKDWFLENKRSEVPECRNNEDGPSLIMEEQHKCSSKSLEHKTETPPVEENVTQKISDLEICADEFPGSSATYRILETNPEYDPSRCFAFVHDLCDEEKSYPVPKGSLDIIILIFVLSAIVPDKMQKAINRLSRLLKPGGMMLLRDYGRYDMAQLRFKKEELDMLFTTAGLEKVQNLVDRRLQVNRGKQLTMYRVWIQCKYCKPLLSSTS
ncbi:hypothetical protein EGK_08852 [Macaca mulatta]|uniref:tRNA N(3)-cytidine methyltransferase n=1 Tax=Macaca mulatta TaxID=9544 RepID=G7NJ68_MACMU|nr:hypothetical protein EGK_08852 [Macaca mulatta]